VAQNSLEVKAFVVLSASQQRPRSRKRRDLTQQLPFLISMTRDSECGELCENYAIEQMNAVGRAQFPATL
jgi:hypothetical protein